MRLSFTIGPDDVISGNSGVLLNSRRSCLRRSITNPPSGGNHYNNRVNRGQKFTVDHQRNDRRQRRHYAVCGGLRAIAINDIQEQCLDIIDPAVRLFPAIFRNLPGHGHYGKWWCGCRYPAIVFAPFHFAPHPAMVSILACLDLTKIRVYWEQGIYSLSRKRGNYLYIFRDNFRIRPPSGEKVSREFLAGLHWLVNWFPGTGSNRRPSD